jgi:hypothetical protein
MYESTQNEVKGKMIENVARNVAPKSHERRAREKICIPSQLTLDCSRITVSVDRNGKTFRCNGSLIEPLSVRETSLSVPPSIMKTISCDALFVGAHRKSDGERKYGRFE